MLVATNAGTVKVWKFNPSHDARGRFASRGGGGGGGGGGGEGGAGGGGTVAVPPGVTSSHVGDRRSMYQTTTYTGPGGKVSLENRGQGAEYTVRVTGTRNSMTSQIYNGRDLNEANHGLNLSLGVIRSSSGPDYLSAKTVLVKYIRDRHVSQGNTPRSASRLHGELM